MPALRRCRRPSARPSQNELSQPGGRKSDNRLTVTPKPFVQIACACEKVLHERDNVASLIRVVDTYTLDAPKALPPGIKAVIALTLFVSLKAGDVVGEHEIGLSLTKPDGTVSAVGSRSLRFGGGETGVNLQVGFEMESPALGLYWFDVLWGEEVLTRIPLRLKPKISGEPSPESTETETTQPQVVS
jgi:hypothetical protein